MLSLGSVVWCLLDLVSCMGSVIFSGGRGRESSQDPISVLECCSLPVTISWSYEVFMNTKALNLCTSQMWMETYLSGVYRYPEIQFSVTHLPSARGWSWAVTFLDMCPKSITASDGRCFIIHYNALGRGSDHLSTTYLPWFSCRHTSKSNWVYQCLHFL